MKIGHLFKTKGCEIYSITSAKALTDAVGLMMAHRTGSLAVMENARIVGIVTERDVMHAVNTRLNDFADITVREVMTDTLVCCRADDTLDDAMERLFDNETGRRVRHLPVMDGERLLGIISIGDIVQALLTQMRFENSLLRNYIKNWPEAES